MSNQLKKSLAARIAAIVAAVVLLWLTVCFGILTILCIHLGAFTDGQLSAVQMLSLTYYSEADSNHSQDDLRRICGRCCKNSFPPKPPTCGLR